MDDETRALIEAIEKRFDMLREADREAVRLRHQDLTLRLEGFPQQFATKQEAEEAAKALQRLERDQVSREIYETNHKALADLVSKLDREKTSEAAFQTFVDGQRRRDEEAATERRAVASALATSTARESGVSATWKQIGALIAAATAVISIVVLLANNVVFH
jgi:hypothetical protein